MEKYIDVNGVTLCVEETGEGKPLFLIHGLTGNKETMAIFPEILGPGRKYIAVDTRGHGKSTKPESYTLADHGEDLDALIRAMGYEKADVLGYSMGSYISLCAAESHSDVIDHLILLASKPSGVTSSVERIVTAAGFDMKTIAPEKMFELIMAAALAPENLAKFGRGELKIDMTAIAGAPMTNEEKKAESLSLANFDLTPGLGQVSCRTLVLSAQYDGINPPELGREIADGIHGARYVCIEGASHLVPYERPEELARLVNGFLAE